MHQVKSTIGPLPQTRKRNFDDTKLCQATKGYDAIPETSRMTWLDHESMDSASCLPLQRFWDCSTLVKSANDRSSTVQQLESALRQLLVSALTMHSICSIHAKCRLHLLKGLSMPHLKQAAIRGCPCWISSSLQKSDSMKENPNLCIRASGCSCECPSEVRRCCLPQPAAHSCMECTERFRFID